MYGESGVGISSLAFRFFFLSFFLDGFTTLGELSVLEIPDFRRAATCAAWGTSSAGMGSRKTGGFLAVAKGETRAGCGA
jgi:hypothetical protein